MREGITGMEGLIYFFIGKITTYVEADCIDRMCTNFNPLSCITLT